MAIYLVKKNKIINLVKLNQFLKITNYIILFFIYFHLSAFDYNVVYRV